MNRFTKALLVSIVVISSINIALADRGIGKRSKSKVSLNINIPTSLKNAVASNLKSKAGLVYTGSLISDKKVDDGSVMTTSLITYKKGNTTYIIPYKQKVTMPEVKQGYTGVKLVIRSKK